MFKDLEIKLMEKLKLTKMVGKFLKFRLTVKLAS